MRGVFDDALTQPEVAVRLVLDATKQRVGSQRLTRAEHKRITREVMEGTPESISAVMRRYTPARNVPKHAAGAPDTGPGWIPGACAPPARFE